MDSELVTQGRRFLRSDLWTAWAGFETDQRKKLSPLPAQKPYPAAAHLVDLVAAADLRLGDMPLRQAIGQRRSHRNYTPEPLTLEELSFLLWASGGLDQVFDEIQASHRTAPSAGGRHPFETYLFANRVTGLAAGLYRYLPVEHKLCLVRDASQDSGLADRLNTALFEQYVKAAAVSFVWSAIPYRTEWRYSVLSHKVIAIDAGHVCQNLYLAAEAIGAGACAIGAYHQGLLDEFLGVDGIDEFGVYAARVGKVRVRGL